MSSLNETKFQGLVDKRNTLMLFGLYCNYPKYILDENYKTVESDYSSEFHKKIWGALNNICKKYNPNKITALEIENELSLFKTTLDIWNANNGVQYIENAIKLTKDKAMNIDLYRDNVRKYSILRNAVEQLGMDISFIYEEYDELDTFDSKLKDKEIKMKNFHNMKSDAVLKLITNKILDFKSLWNEKDSDNYSFHLGDGIKDRIESHKHQENAWGYPFQSGYMTTIFRGMRGSKFMVRSSKSGGGKYISNCPFN